LRKAARIQELNPPWSNEIPVWCGLALIIDPMLVLLLRDWKQ
jgi:hypothetical protein